MTHANGAATTVAAPSASPRTYEVGDRVTLAEHARQWRLVCEYLNDHDRGVVLLHDPTSEPLMHSRVAHRWGPPRRVLWADGCRTWEWAADLAPADPPDTEE